MSRISRVSRRAIFTGATVGGAYVLAHYFVHGDLPELPHWAHQNVDRIQPPMDKFWERPNDRMGLLKQTQPQGSNAEANVVPKRDEQSQTMPARGEAKIANAVEGMRPKQSTETAPTIDGEDEVTQQRLAKKSELIAAIQPPDVVLTTTKAKREDKKESGKAKDTEFESLLIRALDAANRHAKAAASAKYGTVQALQQHAKLLKEAVDSDVAQKGEGTRAKWDEVKSAKEEANRCAETDRERERSARDAIKELETLISSAKQRKNGSSDVPLLRNARETSSKLASRLDELNLLLGQEQAQMRVFTNYRDLVEQGKQQWAEELNSIFPGIDLRAKQGQLSQEELDAFIVHANIRIDQLKRQLAEHQVLEDKRVMDAVEEQRKLDESLSKMALEIERQRARDGAEANFGTRIEQEQKAWEAEMDRQLKRAAIAHAEHLERVIRTQKQIHDVENEQLVEETVAIERHKFAKQIENALTKLAAIEASLQSRAALDLENRRAKIYWTICQSLMEALINGGMAQSDDGTQKTPYKTPLREVALLKQLAENDTFAQSVCSHFPPEIIGLRGVPTERGLMNRFEKVYKLARRTAQIGDEGGTLLRYIGSWLQSLVTFELSNAYSAEDRVDLNRYDPYELLARCRHFVQQGDLLNAVRVANLIRGESARIFADWLDDAKLHLEVRLLVELLFAHSQASGIRTIY